ncbi:MAG TPA: hypothetical protein VK962_03235 [Actinomycetota bacterium]|nr:hypothetical protein [Actinomycetota bacterium]
MTVGLLAHGLGGRVDLPVPRGLFVFGAVTALIVSFVALAVLWPEPRLEKRRPRPIRAAWLRSVMSSAVLGWVVRAAGLVVFGVTTLAAFRPVGPTDTIAPVMVFIWFWVGLAILQAVFGNVWAALSPWDTLGRLLQLDPPAYRPPRTYPKALGRWPAAVLLFGFVWFELASPLPEEPRALGIAIVAYTAITVAGMAAFGRAAWLENGEAFGVYFGLLGRISPLVRDDEGLLAIRPVLSGLPHVEPRPGLLALIVVALGSTTFDGLSRTTWWLDATASLTQGATVAAATAGLLGTILAVAAVYSGAMVVAAGVVEASWHPLAVRFAHSLVPIVLAYVVAHYFSFLLIEGQIGLNRISDPLGLGWNLFGTAGWRVNLTIVSATTTWYVQVAAIVLGHIGGVVLAHDRAIALFDRSRAMRTQYALLAAMVLFTATGLLILSGG